MCVYKLNYSYFILIRRPKSCKKNQTIPWKDSTQTACSLIVSEDMECSSFHCRPASQYPWVGERKQVNSILLHKISLHCWHWRGIREYFACTSLEASLKTSDFRLFTLMCNFHSNIFSGRHFWKLNSIIERKRSYLKQLLKNYILPSG